MPFDWPTIIDTVRQSIVRVRSGPSLGTAFPTDGGYFITARHVLSSPSDIQLETPGGERFAARLVDDAQPAALDLARLNPTIALDLPGLRLGELSDARVGEDVLFAGYPLDHAMPLTFHKAMIAFIGQASLPSVGEAVRCLQLDGSVNLGNSGGPVINSSGEVVAVVNARYGALTEFLVAFLRDQQESREVLARLGVTGGVQMGRVQLGDRIFKQFDTEDAQQALIDIARMLRDYTNVGIGWAISSEYMIGFAEKER